MVRLARSVDEMRQSKNNFILSLICSLIFVITACGASNSRVHLQSETQERLVVPSPSGVGSRKTSALWDTYYLQTALELIDGAEEEIDIVQFEYSYGKAVDKIQKALVRAVKRGVRVRVWLDDEPKASHKSIPYLERNGIEAELDNSDSRVHTKMILVDRKKVLFGSTNFSPQSILYNHETDMRVDDSLVGNACYDYAMRLRAAPSEPAGLQPVRIENFELHFDRTFEEALMKLVESAKKSIDLQMYGTSLYLDDPMSPPTRAFNLLRDAVRRGVEVRVVLERAEESNFSEKTNSLNKKTADYLKAAGVKVKFDRSDVISHAKLLIVDDIATVGSMNWGFGGFRRYHEINAIVSEETSVSDLKRYFEVLWEEAE